MGCIRYKFHTSMALHNSVDESIGLPFFIYAILRCSTIYSTACFLSFVFVFVNGVGQKPQHERRRPHCIYILFTTPVFGR